MWLPLPGVDTASHAGETISNIANQPPGQHFQLVQTGSVTIYSTNLVMVLFILCVCSCSPFEVQVSEEAGPQKVRAWGPGLETGMVGKSADFVVEAIGTEVGTLGTSHRWRGRCSKYGPYWLCNKLFMSL